MRFQAPRGTQDILPDQSHRWQRLESDFRALAMSFGYREIRTPIFEDTELFSRTSGETSDIVSKQMYTFMDKGDRQITLKPEQTAPTIRAVIEHNLCPTGSIGRFFYITPFFRYERPQKGRFRQAHQCGLELLGSASATADAEIIEATVRFYESLGLNDLIVSLNSLGRDACRAAFREAILAHAAPFIKDAESELHERILKNPLRLLDSKDEVTIQHMKSAPSILEFLEPECRQRFDDLQQLLTDASVAFEVRPEIVRGLDYYTETVFEVQSAKLGAQSALCGGGRYDNLVKELGGASTPSVGVGIGIERALMVLDEEGISWLEDVPRVFIATTDPETTRVSLEIARKLRSSGISVLNDPDFRSLKSQLRQADRSGARYVVVVGSDELRRGSVVLRDMKTSDQSEVAIDQLATKVLG